MIRTPDQILLVFDKFVPMIGVSDYRYLGWFGPVKSGLISDGDSEIALDALLEQLQREAFRVGPAVNCVSGIEIDVEFVGNSLHWTAAGSTCSVRKVR